MTKKLNIKKKILKDVIEKKHIKRAAAIIRKFKNNTNKKGSVDN